MSADYSQKGSKAQLKGDTERVVRAFTLRSSDTQYGGGQPTDKSFQSAWGEESLKHSALANLGSIIILFYCCHNFFSIYRFICGTMSLNWQFLTIFSVSARTSPSFTQKSSTFTFDLEYYPKWCHKGWRNAPFSINSTGNPAVATDASPMPSKCSSSRLSKLW